MNQTIRLLNDYIWSFQDNVWQRHKWNINCKCPMFLANSLTSYANINLKTMRYLSLHSEMFQVLGIKNRLCKRCMMIRSTADELQPTSLKDLIIDIKNDLRLADMQRNEFIEMTKFAYDRLKMAESKKSHLRRELVAVEEKKERAESKLEKVDARLEGIRKAIESSEDRISRCTIEEENRRQTEEELKKDVEHAKTWKQEILQHLTLKLGELSQLGYHCRYLQEKSEDDRIKIMELESKLDLLRERGEYQLLQRKEYKSNAVKYAAAIEQYEEDIMRSRRKCNKARERLNKMMLWKDRLHEALYDAREKRRDLTDDLEGIKKAEKNSRSIIHPNYPIQRYR